MTADGPYRGATRGVYYRQGTKSFGASCAVYFKDVYFPMILSDDDIRKVLTAINELAADGSEVSDTSLSKRLQMKPAQVRATIQSLERSTPTIGPLAVGKREFEHTSRERMAISLTAGGKDWIDTHPNES